MNATEGIRSIAEDLLQKGKRRDNLDSFLREVAGIALERRYLLNSYGLTLRQLPQIFSAEQLKILREVYDASPGGSLQPKPRPLPAGEEEALLFGRQRDCRLPYRFIIKAKSVAGSVARLAVPRIFNGVRRRECFYGTGWLIAPNILITNHHVIEARDHRPRPYGLGEGAAKAADFKQQAEEVVAWFDFYEDRNGCVECVGGRLLGQDEELDYAIVELAESDKLAGREPLRIAQPPPRLERGNRLNIVQHPRGEELKFAIRNNFFVQMGATRDFLRYQTDTEPGGSGSPVCDDEWRVVALHHASIEADEKLVPPQEIIEGDPVTVYVLNEGVSIYSILDDLDEAVRRRIG